MVELHRTAGRTSAFRASRVAPGPWAPGPLARAATLLPRSRLNVSAAQRRFLQQPTMLGCQGDCRRGSASLLATAGACSLHTTCDWSMQLKGPPTSPGPSI